jgi:hypothetical protein
VNIDMARKLLALIGIAAGVAACGGSSSSPVTRAQWITQADAICASADAQIRALPTPNSAKQLQTQLGSLVPLMQSQLAKLHALTPPAADQASVDSILAAASQTIPLIKRLSVVAATGDLAKIQQWETAHSSDLAGAARAAAAFGLKVCGKPAASA